MLQSEKRSLVRFLVIYLTSTLLLFSLASWIFYTATKHQIIDQQRTALKYEADHIISKLRLLHNSNEKKLIYPRSKSIDSAIYDTDKKYIFGSYSDEQSLQKGKETDMLYFIKKVEPYYLGAAYLRTSKKLERAPIEKLQKSIGFFMLVAGALFLVLGYYLGRLFVAPMRESLEKMNHFIQDTTHELNTPISTILTNIEMIETFGKHKESSSELKRIEIASKTLSRIYDDLTYLNLNHHYHRQVVTVNMVALIQERVAYFSAMSGAKNLNVILKLEENFTLEIDKNDALRVVDNLISNAIKYNKQNGLLEISLSKESLIVRDTGIGISAEDLKYIMQRFKRANKSEGGFGIGLHIVSQVCENYQFEFEIKSILHEGTEVHIRWKK